MFTPSTRRSPHSVRAADRLRDERGFSLVELIMAMFLLAVLALAVLPLLIGATQAGAANRMVVAANAFATGQLASLRAAFPDDADNVCEGPDGSVSSVERTDVVDPDSGLLAAVRVDACPDSFPGTVVVTTCVYRVDSPPADVASSACPRSQPLTKLVTRIVVSS